MNIYTDGKEHLDLTFLNQKDRNAKARELRREGWNVKCKTVSFSDLARGGAFFLYASK